MSSSFDPDFKSNPIWWRIYKRDDSTAYRYLFALKLGSTLIGSFLIWLPLVTHKWNPSAHDVDFSSNNKHSVALSLYCFASKLNQPVTTTATTTSTSTALWSWVLLFFFFFLSIWFRAMWLASSHCAGSFPQRGHKNRWISFSYSLAGCEAGIYGACSSPMGSLQSATLRLMWACWIMNYSRCPFKLPTFEA